MQWCLGEILILMRGAAGRILNDWSSTKQGQGWTAEGMTITMTMGCGRAMEVNWQ